MITSAIFYLFYVIAFVFTLPFRLLPDVAVDNNISSAIATMVNWLSIYKQFTVLAAVTFAFLTILVVEGIIATYKIVMWITKRVHGA